MTMPTREDLAAEDIGPEPVATASVDDGDDLHEGPFERIRRALRGGFGRSLVSLVVGLGIWELVGRVLVTNRTFFVPFSIAVQSIYTAFADGSMLTNLPVSVLELLGGFAVALIVGISVGTVMGLFPKVRSALIFWVDVFNATPVLALAPLFILALGVDMTSKVAFIAFVAVWTILLNTMTGFMHSDQGMLEMVQSFGGTAWQKFVIVRVPVAIPSIAVGLRVAIGRAVVGIVVGELFGSVSGLGFYLFSSRDKFDTGGIYAAIIMLALLALVAVNLMSLLERRLSRWR